MLKYSYNYMTNNIFKTVGGDAGGGGGAGEVIETTYVVTKGVTYIITVGAGGSSNSDYGKGNNGYNTTFSVKNGETIFRAAGGGAGGGLLHVNGVDGGSGGV